MVSTSAYVEVAGWATAVTALILTSAICVTSTYAVGKQIARILLGRFAVLACPAGVETDSVARILMNVTPECRVTNLQAAQIRTDRIYVLVPLVSQEMEPIAHVLTKLLLRLLWRTA